MLFIILSSFESEEKIDIMFISVELNAGVRSSQRQNREQQ